VKQVEKVGNALIFWWPV